MSRLVLVTGGNGAFGSVLVSALADRGDQVRVLDVVAAASRRDEVEMIRGDVRSPGDVRRAVEGVDVVFHNVAAPLTRDTSLFESVNVGGTNTLLYACERAR
ncbi:MAG: NAD-dependent epimerase/dehydratase family protein, partial [Nocardioidaceae bacterium]